MRLHDKLLSRKRSIIETINDQLRISHKSNILDIGVPPISLLTFYVD